MPAVFHRSGRNRSLIVGSSFSINLYPSASYLYPSVWYFRRWNLLLLFHDLKLIMFLNQDNLSTDEKKTYTFFCPSFCPYRVWLQSYPTFNISYLSVAVTEKIECHIELYDRIRKLNSESQRSIQTSTFTPDLIYGFFLQFTGLHVRIDLSKNWISKFIFFCVSLSLFLSRTELLVNYAKAFLTD